MADTALGPEEIKEFHDSPEVLAKKIKVLAQYFREAKYPTVYTGAGVSTSAGVPDFRGPNGCWTRKAKLQRGESVPDQAGRPEYTRVQEEQQKADRSRDAKRIAVRPTLAHMAIVELMRQDLCKFLYSSNCDGLHLKSGIPPDKITEVHGNSNVEYCSTCGTSYHRGFARVRTQRLKSRCTGRKCDDPSCNGVLRYTTVAFNQSMPDIALSVAEKHAKRSDLVLTLGTSMSVFPSCDLPLLGKRRNHDHKLVLVNLQKTPVDDKCALRIFAKTDDVLNGLFQELGLSIPGWEGPSLIENDEWRERFSASWPFRTAGEDDWFEGPHIKRLGNAGYYDWCLKMAQAVGNKQFHSICLYLQKMEQLATRATEAEFTDSKSQLSKYCRAMVKLVITHANQEQYERLAPSLIGQFESRALQKMAVAAFKASAQKEYTATTTTTTTTGSLSDRKACG